MQTNRHSRFRQFLAAGASLWLVAGVADAQFSGLPGAAPSKAEAPSKPEAKESIEQSRARVRKLLDEARAETERPPQAVPPGIEPRETTEQRELQSRLVAIYDIQLRTLDQLERMRPARQAAEARERDWTGFEAPPPYSILRLDELRDAADTARDRIQPLEASLAQMPLDAQRTQDELARAEADLRRAEETHEAVSAPEDKARAAWRRDLARLKVRSSAGAVTTAGLLRELWSDTLATRRAETALLERQIGVMSRNATFTEADLATARKRIDDKIDDVRRDLAALEGQVGRRLRERDAAREALERVRASAGSTPAERTAAEVRLEAAEAWIDAGSDQTDALRGLVVLGNQLSAAWGARFAALHDPDAEARRIAAAKVREFAPRSARFKTLTESKVRDSRAKLNEVETRLADLDTAPAAVRYGQEMVAARRGVLLATERVQTAIDATVRQYDRWVADLDAASGQRDLRARLTDGWLALRDGARAVWNFELFAVEDTTVTDGQTIAVSRGVTVGKSVGAVMIFLLGYLTLAGLARRVEHRFVARGIDAARARTARRWVLALSAVFLLLLTLNVARIPFTVFAFLGGALAIGAGFGTQTLIKNLVSGMVVMMERQVRVGDIVEVDNTSGTVTEVNLRSSTVRGADGVEAIVPNSVFVENKVTNWTRSDRRVRRVIKVGVAYGSPVREVADLLEACAKRHGLVLGDPAPLVIFEDFGDSALVFALYVWLDLGPNVNAMQVLSDLRFIIEKSFAEARIVIAYPQRDLHLDSARPLRVEVVREQERDPPP